MLWIPMPSARSLDPLLRCVLALVLGLGPGGASVLAASLHAPLCGCEGCGPASADEGCCPAGEREESRPLVSAPGGSCGCLVVAEEEERCPLTLVRPGHGREGAVEARRAREPESPPAPVASARADLPPGRASPPGPPGSQRLHGAARAAARGLLLL